MTTTHFPMRRLADDPGALVHYAADWQPGNGPACAIADPDAETAGDLDIVTCEGCVDSLITEACVTIERLWRHPSGNPDKRARAYALKEAGNRRLMALDHLTRARELAGR